METFKLNVMKLSPRQLLTWLRFKFLIVVEIYYDEESKVKSI